MRTVWNTGWSFTETLLHTDYETVMREDAFLPVMLPHDWLITDTRGLYRDSTGWYRKRFRVDRSLLPADAHVFIRFDGIYMDSRIYLDGKQIAEWKYGYSPLTIELTDGLSEGDHELAVRVDHQAPNSRWYSGAGIFRDVSLIVKDADYLPEDGVYVHTVRAEDGTWMLRVETEIAAAQTADTLMVQQELESVDRDGHPQSVRLTLVSTEETSAPAPYIQGGAFGMADPEDRPRLRHVIQVFSVQGAEAWSPDRPQLYALKTSLQDGAGQIRDMQQTKVGFREIRLDPDQGFFLNGEQLKLNGVCEHHDHGALGAVFQREAMRRKFDKLRAMGVNALRLTHNMAAEGVLELADEMGFLLISEGFDMWEGAKTEYDYARFFPAWHGRDVEAWIRRDRNHPSVVFWSIGNEIYDTHGSPRGQKVTADLKKHVEMYDPQFNARVTIGSNYMPWEGAQKCADILKIAGYNYAEKCYEAHHKAHPDWVIYGSETSSIVHSRGIYHFPLSSAILSDDDRQCSALGNSATSWGARSYEACVTQDRDMPFSMGQFLWTGFDYIGEPTPYHTKNSYFGQLDTAGFPKDAYFIWRAAWTDVQKDPMVHVFPYWDFNEGQCIDVRVCSNADVVELFVNGESLGQQTLDNKPQSGSHIIADYQVPYRAGRLTARGYVREADGNLHQVAEETHHSFGNSSRIHVQTDWCSNGIPTENECPLLYAGSEDLLYLRIRTLDAEGYPVENAVDRVQVRVTGAGRLIGLDNGDSTDEDSYQGTSRRLFSGRLLAIIAPGTEPGEILVEVSGAGLVPAEFKVSCVSRSETPAPKTAIQDVDTWLPLPENHVCPVLLGSAEEIPVRRIALKPTDGLKFDKFNRKHFIEASVEPPNATDHQLIWRAVTDEGVDTNLASLSGDYKGATLTALGDGHFRLRAESKSGTEEVRVISELECEITGLGAAFLDPYGFVAASLYTRSIGEVGPGNERGVASAREGETVIIFDHIDFGKTGSDRITMPIFALDGNPYPICLWQGVPGEEGSELVADVVYQKPSIWNTYQPETWTLNRRLTGVQTLSVVVHQKLHLKGFSFEKILRGFEQISAGAADAVYGDSFRRETDAITGIGNNVSVEFDGMDFGDKQATGITVCGRTPNEINTIHIQLEPKDTAGTLHREILEFRQTDTYEEQTFTLTEPLTGVWKVVVVFLPGSNFDLSYIRFK